MRIWFVNHYALPPGSTGGPTRHLGLGRALRDRGHDVTIIASIFDHYARQDHRRRTDCPWTVEDIDGVTYVWISTPRYGSTVERARNIAVFAARVARHGPRLPLPAPDVVVGSSPHLLAPWAAKRVATKRGAAFVVEIRDIWPQSLVDLGELSGRHPLVVSLRWLERHLYRSADGVITVLPHAGAHFLSHGASADHLHVVPNGVEDRALAGERVAHDGFVVVYAGTMGLANGLDVAVDAAQILRRRGRDDITLRLVGGGPEHQHLVHRASDLPNVSVEPALAAHRIPSLLSEADAGLLILRDSPVFRWGISPTKLFDYMAAGLPIVVSVRSPGDPASDAGAAVRAEPGDPAALADAFEHLAGLPANERMAMGKRGREAVGRYTFPALAERMEAILEVAARRSDAMR